MELADQQWPVGAGDPGAPAPEGLVRPAGSRGAGLRIIGDGPASRRCDWSKVTPKTRAKILALEVGEGVEVLLDNGEIVRSTVRHPARVQTPAQAMIWVEGISGGYAASRCRPARWTWRLRGASG